MSEQFWTVLVQSLVGLGFAWIGYLRLKAGQDANKEKLGQVQELVNGNHTAMANKIERLEGVISTAAGVETARLKQEIKDQSPKTGDQP